MQHDRILKKINFGLGYVSYLLLLCLHAKFQQKILIVALVIAKFKYLTFNPLGGVKGGGVKL